MDFAKDIFVVVGGSIGVLAFAKGVIEYVHSNAIRRYEKFQLMSVRFDQNEHIQKVCDLLHAEESEATAPAVTKQQKEIFICFLEEAYFMMNSGIMKRDIALHTFGYYADKANKSSQFWHDLKRNERFYAHFIHFCELASAYRPKSHRHKRALAY